MKPDRNTYKKRMAYILKHNILIQAIYRFVLSNVFRVIGFFIKTDNHLVLMNAYGGLRYNDSPKAIGDYLYSHYEYRNLRIVWAFERPDDFNIPFEKIKIDTWDYFYTALKAKYWISCVNIERGLHFKKAATRYLNTWHGIPIKTIGNAVKGRNDFDFSNVNVFCYSCSFEKSIYIRDLGVLERNMIMCGLPRNDELYHVTPERIGSLRLKLDIPDNKKIILYVPTWRESSDKGKSYTLTSPIDAMVLEQQLGDTYILLVRAHHFVTQLLGIQFNNFIRDVSEYPEINELMIIADILISDYSAAIFDYAILERPVISFAFDYKEYTDSHGLYMDLEKELDGRLVKTQEELINKIKLMDYNDECKKTAVFKKKYIEEGGNAAETYVKALFDGYC
ncbi:hypothetical protein FACS189485_12640 [Spirochaetia bacterium]|nr:hypothetical protein FACS189485_12640 [Spirochaetia bacterium]